MFILYAIGLFVILCFIALLVMIARTKNAKEFDNRGFVRMDKNWKEIAH